MDKTDKDLVEQIHLHLQTNFCVSVAESRNILKTIAFTLKKNMSDLIKACEGNDLLEMARHLHSIKGALLNLGQNDLAEMTELIEIASRAGEKRNYLISVRKIEDLLKPLIKQ